MNRYPESQSHETGRGTPGEGIRRFPPSPYSLALAVALAAITTASCSEKGPAQVPPPIVQVLEVTATNVPLTAEFIGHLDSPQNVQVRARVEAFVDKILFVEGSEVREGQPLFELDKKPYLEQVAAAQGSLGEARAALNKYEKDVARLQPLAEKRAIPQQDLDNAVALVDVGKANVDSALARVESAKLNLSYCDVRAPVPGLIGAKEVSLGDLVGKGLPTLLATISQLDPIWFYCNVSEVDYLRAAQRVRETGERVADLPVTLIQADGSEFPEQGKWVFIDRAVDPTTGTLRMRAEFANPEKVLRPGMFARARISMKTEKESILVPQRAVLELQGKNFVWVVGSDNKASQRLVTTGPQIGSDWVVQEGLKPGERIVVEGVQKAREGETVQPQTAAQKAQGPATQPSSAQPAGE